MLAHGALAFLLLALIQLAFCAEDYYKVLGVDRSVGDRELKSAYRKLSKKFHPDKNPNDDTAHEKFVEVSNAYEVLSDENLRTIYDRYGHDGVESHRQGGGPRQHNPFDLFSDFFGGGGHRRGPPGKPRGRDTEFKLEITLADFYNGVETQFEWNKQHICDHCDGTGSADRKVDKCSACNGQGVRIIKKQFAPGMFQQMQRPCDVCDGRGEKPKNKCPHCHGSRVIRKQTPVDLKIERGVANGETVVFEEEADESPDWHTGNLVIHLAEKRPSMEENPNRLDGVFFRRRGDDLFWTEVLSLREAWMGDWTRNITHLDAHVVRLGRPKGKIVQPGQVETVVGEGMPRWHEDGDSVYHKHEFGNLYVTYEVVLPDQMDKKMQGEFWDLWEKWRSAKGVDLHKDSGRPDQPPVRDEL
jgi:DnaJ-related protein SCJ1